jgi:hypothetical protein
MAYRRTINWLRLRSDEAERIVHEWSKESAKVQLSLHALERVDERQERGSLTDVDVFAILRTGMVAEAPFRNEHGHWQCKILKRILGEREAGAVVVILERERKILVRTVEWEDLR